MAANINERLEPILQALGTDSLVSLLVVFGVSVAIAAIRGLYTLTSGWHTRRKEFMEVYEKVRVGPVDPLMMEIAIRHGFGIWIPAAAIQRIRQLPSPSGCLLKLGDVIGFLEPNATDGNFAIKLDYVDPIKRRVRMVIRFAMYLVLASAAALFFGLLREFSVPVDDTARLIIGVMCVICAFYSLDSAYNIRRLSMMVEEYPELFVSDRLPMPVRTSSLRMLWQAAASPMYRWWKTFKRLESRAEPRTAPSNKAQAGRKGMLHDVSPASTDAS